MVLPLLLLVLCSQSWQTRACLPAPCCLQSSACLWAQGTVQALLAVLSPCVASLLLLQLPRLLLEAQRLRMQTAWGWLCEAAPGGADHAPHGMRHGVAALRPVLGGHLSAEVCLMQAVALPPALLLLPLPLDPLPARLLLWLAAAGGCLWLPACLHHCRPQ